MLERAALALVEALENLVQEDPEALVDRRLLRDPEDARELVLQRADPVRLDVRGRQHQPVAAAGDERLQSLAVGRRPDRVAAPALVALRVAQVLVERAQLEELRL